MPGRYIHDPEGNGVETYVDSPFHVAQPYASTWKIANTNEEILENPRRKASDKPEFQLMKAWSVTFTQRLDKR
jgi:catechol 2,3-dioxygenase